MKELKGRVNERKGILVFYSNVMKAMAVYAGVQGVIWHQEKKRRVRLTRE